MNERYLSRGKRLDNGEWVDGYYVCISGKVHVIYTGKIDIAYLKGGGGTPWQKYEVDPATIGQCTGRRAAKSYRGDSEDARLIFAGDITELVLPDGEVRRFVVEIRTVIRKVISHPDFDEPMAKVAITGVVFLWNGFELFPCVDENGADDASKMSIIGNIHNNPELMEGVK